MGRKPRTKNAPDQVGICVGVDRFSAKCPCRPAFDCISSLETAIGGGSPLSGDHPRTVTTPAWQLEGGRGRAIGRRAVDRFFREDGETCQRVSLL